MVSISGVISDVFLKVIQHCSENEGLSGTSPISRMESDELSWWKLVTGPFQSDVQDQRQVFAKSFLLPILSIRWKLMEFFFFYIVFRRILLYVSLFSEKFFSCIQNRLEKWKYQPYPFQWEFVPFLLCNYRKSISWVFAKREPILNLRTLIGAHLCLLPVFNICVVL